jgi:hypothetical protein
VVKIETNEIQTNSSSNLLFSSFLLLVLRQAAVVERSFRGPRAASVHDVHPPADDVLPLGEAEQRRRRG